ncbi:hypothetical protein [Staphylococcus kloosii]|uniref:Phage protein n=1 Tax=Staphylococcus kloosii TaxID=29384 RepID=A0ABQ0XN80_9STAP|nr:hypothetical protein [Staphylococcus kloosii]AVQ36596.1 hypothetical protein C7J89_10680 [Staphylococcus kloosii]PNZ03976.1 hypothetical protein CD136_09930 [Staphylococcus kloosii]GEP81419.1 hypothetical protein SKL01_05970 [Staphylococcus kloosii]SUM49688.1 Uncharacterised protein [Staphylococcus kloosii]
MFWIITSIVLAVIAIVTLILNTVKDNQNERLEAEVAYLLNIIFNERGDVLFRLKDEDVRDIKDELDKRIK